MLRAVIMHIEQLHCHAVIPQLGLGLLLWKAGILAVCLDETVLLALCV